MPPRRTRRVGLKRIDAAVDACTLMGFSPDFIRSKVKELLNVYGGDEGWVFIEEASYKVLIEAMLEDQEKQGCEAGAVPQLEPGERAQQHNADLLAGPSNAGLEWSSKQDAEVATTETGWKLVCSSEDTDLPNLDAVLQLVYPKPNVESVNPQAVNILPVLPPQEKSQNTRCRHQLGWISRGNTDENFVLLTPYPVENPKARRSKTRWDLKPE